MNPNQLPQEFLKLLRSVKAKRPRTVIEHIIKHGSVTTEELQTLYGYNHPPRAARDVREQGIPIVTIRVSGTDGRRIGAYTFGNPADMHTRQLSGRTARSSRIKAELVSRHGARCNIYLERFPERELQIDHRIPFEIGGEGTTTDDAEAFMLLSPSANRAKSWSCENCDNWKQRRIEICRGCYWAFPENYSHVAMREMRRLDVVWTGDDVEEYELLRRAAAEVREPVPEYVKRVLRTKLIKKPRGSG